MKKLSESLPARLLIGVIAGAVLGMLSMLFLLGCENQQRTAAGVYASRTGRKLCRHKVLAGITWALAVYLLLERRLGRQCVQPVQLRH